MIVSTNATASRSTSQLLRLSEAAKLTGLDPQALRRLANKGVVKTRLAPSGHRYFIRANLQQLISGSSTDEPVEDADTTTDAIPVLLLARVSSIAQSQKRGNSEASDLERQIERLREYQREHYPNARIYESFRVASGCNFRSKELHDAVRLIWTGKLRGGVLIATYFDRVLRIGWELIELACEDFGVTVVYISPKSDDEDPQKMMIDELLSIMCMYTARASGQKCRENQKVFMDAELLKRTWKLSCSGYSVRAIKDLYESEGLKDAKNRAYTSHVIFTLLKENEKTLVTLYGHQGEETSLTRFLAEHVKETGDEKDKVFRATLLESYRKYCLLNNLTFLEDAKSSREINKLGWKRKLASRKKITMYQGIKMVQCCHPTGF